MFKTSRHASRLQRISFSSMSVLLSVLFVSSCTSGRPLTVGTCKGGKQPYIAIGSDGQPTRARGSFEADLWHILYKELEATVRKGYGGKAAQDMLTEVEPKITLYDSDDRLREALRRNEVDVGFCGLVVENPSRAGFDYLPPHMETGLTFVVKDFTSSVKVDFLAVIGEILRPFLDVQAVMSMLILFGVSTIVAHVFWLVELGSDVVFRDEYGPGIIDAFWFSIVTALTVGYGDKVPSTLPGKMLSMLWMLIGTYLLSLLAASLTSSFVVKRLVPSGEIDISRVQDIVLYSAGAIHANTLNILLQYAPGVRMKRYDTYDSLFTSVTDSSLQVGVIDVHVARHLCEVGGEWHGRVRSKGPVFAHKHIAFGVSRPGGKPHALLDVLRMSLVVIVEDSHGDPISREYQGLFAKHMRGGMGPEHHHSELGTDIEDLLHREPGQTEEITSETDASLREEFVRLNSIGGFVLVAFILIWTVSMLAHYRSEILEDRARQRFIKALGLQRRFTVHELRMAAGRIFDQTDTDRSGSLTQEEILGILRSIGKEVTFDDIKPYIEQELEEREEEDEARKREAEALLEEEMRANQDTRPRALDGPQRGQPGAGSEAQVQALNADDAATAAIVPSTGQPSSPTKKSSIATFINAASDMLEDLVDSEPEYEKVLLTREEFVSVVEGFVMDHEEMQDQDDDLRQPAQRRHINTIAGDCQQQMHELEETVKGKVDTLHVQLNAVNRRLDVVMQAIAAAPNVSTPT